MDRNGRSQDREGDRMTTRATIKALTPENCSRLTPRVNQPVAKKSTAAGCSPGTAVLATVSLPQEAQQAEPARSWRPCSGWMGCGIRLLSLNQTRIEFWRQTGGHLGRRVRLGFLLLVARLSSRQAWIGWVARRALEHQTGGCRGDVGIAHHWHLHLDAAGWTNEAELAASLHTQRDRIR